MIVPTDTSLPLTSDQGFTLGAFGSYLLCQGQTQVDALGYSALPINLVEAGFAQLQRIPGNLVPTTTTAFIQSCNNPTFSTDGTNTLAGNDPMPPACDKQGATQCGGSGGSDGTLSEPLAVSIPAGGSFTLTVAPGTVRLALARSSASGTLFPITVSDIRTTGPGWSVSGQAADFTGPGTISGNQLGWVTAGSSIATGVTLGPAVAPGNPGLGSTAAILAHAGNGVGTTTLSANLTLAIPTAAKAGDYTSSLTLTAVTALP
jgi:hypothetical protein